MVWVQGHAGIADNERCDTLAMAACNLSDLPDDPGYVDEVPKQASNERETQITAPTRKRRRSLLRGSHVAIAARPLSSEFVTEKLASVGRTISHGLCIVRSARPCTSWRKPSVTSVKTRSNEKKLMEKRIVADAPTYVMTCPHCKQILKFGDKAIGKTKDCPRCKNPIVVAPEGTWHTVEQPDVPNEETASSQETPLTLSRQALENVVRSARCRVFGWEDAGNDSHRGVLAILIHG